MMTACIYKSKEDIPGIMEPYLVEVYESILKLYNFNPEYIVNEIVKAPKQVSVALMNDNITSAKKSIGMKGEVISSMKV